MYASHFLCLTFINVYYPLSFLYRSNNNIETSSQVIGGATFHDCYTYVTYDTDTWWKWTAVPINFFAMIACVWWSIVDDQMIFGTRNFEFKQNKRFYRITLKLVIELRFRQCQRQLNYQKLILAPCKCMEWR